MELDVLVRISLINFSSFFVPKNEEIKVSESEKVDMVSWNDGAFFTAVEKKAFSGLASPNEILSLSMIPRFV